MALLFMGSAYQIVAGKRCFAFMLPVHRSITEASLSRYSAALISDWERQLILQGVAAGDLVEGGLPFTQSSDYDPRFHFDNEFSYTSVIENYQAIGGLVDENLAKPEKDPWGFGKILHAVQDFYAHSNYVSAYRQYRAEKKLMVDSIPPLEQVFLNPALAPGLLEELQNTMRTGQYPDHALLPNDADHGLPLGPGLNKDLLSRKYFREAKETALEATAWYLKLYVRDPGALKDWKTLRSSTFVAKP